MFSDVIRFSQISMSMYGLWHVWLSYEQGGAVFLRPKIFQGFAAVMCDTIVRSAKPLSYAPLIANYLECYLTSQCFYSKNEMFEHPPLAGLSPRGMVLNSSI